MSMKDKDGCIWMTKRDGMFVISALIPGTSGIEALDSLQQQLKKAGFEEDDRVGLDFKANGTLQIDITLSNAGVTLLQVDLCLKNLVSCLRESGIIKNPIISHIHDRLARAHSMQ